MSRTLRLSLALALLPSGLSAQSIARDTARTTPVVVTATRSPLDLARAPSSVTVIGGEQLRREMITTVAEALRQVPGLTLAQTGSYGGATSLFIRGGESKYTKVLVDGVAVNDAGGSFDLSTLTTDNVERIEIVRGPASVLYGSDAVAGVVQIFTRTGGGPPRGELSARGGGFGSYDADGAVRGGWSHGTASLGAARHGTEGSQAFNSGFRNDVVSGLVQSAIGRGDARLSVLRTDAAFHFPTDGSGQVVDSNAVRRDQRIAIGLDAGWRVSSAVEVRAALASHDLRGVTDNQPDSPGDVGDYYYTTSDRTRRRSGDVRLEMALPRQTHLTLGGQVERQWQASGTVSSFGDNGFTARRRSSGAYAQLLLSPVERYTVALGGRYDHNERYGDFVTYRGAGNMSIGAGTRLRGSVGTAFREPTFLENYGGAFVIGNPSLTPEHALSVDAGIEQAIASWGSVGLTWFANSFRDLIDYQYSETEPNYFNVARTRARGIELEARASLPAGFATDAAFTYLETRVVDPGTQKAVTSTFAPGARLLRRPSHTLNAGLGYRGERGAVHLRALRVGPREDNYYAPDFSVQHVTLPSYVRADLSAELAVLPPRAGRGSAAVTLRVDNLFDERYTDAAGTNYDFRLTDEASLRQTGYRAPGRRALAGVRLGW
ncbi:MAG: TonB-dependent receptor [Gemmatimonadaceae bacterium]